MPTESMSGLYVLSKIESDVARSQTPGEAFKHRAIFYCRLSLRERMEKRYFRRAKGDTCFPHDAKYISTSAVNTDHKAF